MRWPWRRRRRRPVIRISSPTEARIADRYNALAREVRALNDEYERMGGVPPEALTAAGQRVLNGQATLLRRLIMPWQIRSFGYYDMVPEIKYASQFYSRSLSNLRLYVAKRSENGDLEEIGGGDDEGNPRPVTGDDRKALDGFDRIRDPGGGGRSGLLSSYGRLMFLVGETYLFVTQNSRTGKEQWEMLSTDEIRLNDGLYTRFKSPSLPASQFMPAPDDSYDVYARSMGEDGIRWDGAIEGMQYGGRQLTAWDATSAVDNTAIAYRLWRRHPRFSELADATMQGVLELCVAEGTIVNTLRGPVPIEEVKIDDHVFTWAPDGTGVRPVVRHLDRGEQPVFKITAGRRTLRATAEHPLLVLRKSAPGKGHHATYECEWVEVQDLQRGDRLVALDHVPEYGTFQEMPDGTPIFEDVAWLLGQIVGDGHVHQEGLNLSLYNDSRRERVARIMRDNWGLEDHPQGGDARFNSRAFRRTLERMGLRVKSHRKRVPAEILASPESVKRAFLAGYGEADGHLTKRGWQSLALTSERLASELRGLYIELGENVSNPHVEARAAVMAMPGGYTTENAKPLHRFQVYYGSVRRGAVGTLQAKGSREAIGGENFTLSTVKRVVPDGVARTYDLEVEGEHNYIADGIVSHNCEELVLLTQAVRARARSRLAGSGVLFVDDRISPNPLEPVGDEDILVDPFFAALTAAMTAPIVDEGTAAAVVPLIARVRVPDGMKLTDMVYHLQIIDPMQIYPETGLRMECIKRIGIGLDMPSDILLGITDANHWTAWMVDEQSWKAHLQPVAQGLVEDLTSAYLGPYLMDEGVADWDVYVVAYDATAVINHPDRGKDANDAWDRGTIGETSYRAAKGFDEKDAPDDEERMRWLGVQMRDPSLAVYGIPSLRSGSEIEPTEGTIVSPDGTVTAPGGAGESAASVDKTPPATQPQEPLPEDVLGSAATMLVARIEGASLTGMLRAREVAGAKLRTSARRDDDLAGMIDRVPNRDVAATLGAARVRGLIGGAREATLLNGVNVLITDSLRMAGLPADDGIAEQIADTVAGHALRTLYDAQPSLSVTFPEYVRGLITPGR